MLNATDRTTIAAARLRTAVGIIGISLIAGACATGKGGATSGGAATLEGPMWKSKDLVKARCEATLDAARARRDTIRAGGERTLEGTLKPLNQMFADIDATFGWTQLIANTHPDQTAREAAEACERDVQQLITEINLDPGVFAAVNAVATDGLAPGAQRFVERVKREIERAGGDKDEATRARLEALAKEMVEVGQTFSRTIREDVRKLEITDAARLKGLPEDFIKAHQPDEDGKIVLTTNYPDYFPVQRYAEDESLRRELLVLFSSRGHPANDKWLKRLLELRKEKANILGFDTWADYMADDKMVKSAAAIEKFTNDVAAIARPRMERDLAELLARKRQDVPDADAIQTWDRFFYVSKVQNEKYGFDAQAVRPYFDFQKVTDGLMTLYGELFDVEFKRDAAAETWHESVSAYALISGGKTIARFFLDMHPRDGKYGHAAMFPLETGIIGGRVPVASLVCNFPDPSKVEGPALMEHQQVVTYFHEFGHLVHHLLANGSEWVNQGGITAEWDFVEAPSQLLEEWAWDPAVLARFAKHHESGAAIPAEAVAKMKLSSEFGKGVHVMRQLFYQGLSYYLHAADPKDIDLLAFQKEIQLKYMPYPYIEGTYTYAGFGHLEGYSSMYYTYQWSLAIAKDLFTRFKQAGLLDPSTARAYRELVLMPGGSKDAATLVEAFLGRAHNLDAYKAWLQSE